MDIGEMLKELGEQDAATEHLQRHVRMREGNPRRPRLQVHDAGREVILKTCGGRR